MGAMPPSPTHQRLLEVAIDHFGRLGLDGASTRAIAGEAGTPMSSITYHFGGKEGLYIAAAERIAAAVTDRLNPVLQHVRGICGADGGMSDPVLARAALHILIDRLTEIMASDDAAAFSRFIVREQTDPSEAFARVYSGTMGPVTDDMAAMLRCISHDSLGADEARMRAVTLIGQILVFRIARATVVTGMGWQAVGPEEMAAIKRAIQFNVDAILEHMESVAARQAR